jgi:hypothetical protein
MPVFLSYFAYLVLKGLNEILERNFARSFTIKESESIYSVKVSALSYHLLPLYFNVGF